MTMKTAVATQPVSAKTFNVGIVCAQFNPQITDVMFSAAHVYCQNSLLNVGTTMRVPGAFEIPLAAKKMLKQKNIHGVVCLGAIIKGRTEHDIVIGNAVTNELLRLGLEFEKPVGLGIAGPGATEEQARERADEYARRAVEAVRHQLEHD